MLLAINSMSKCAIWVIIPLVTVLRLTWLCLVQLQALEPVTSGIVTQIAHLAMLFIIHTQCKLEARLGLLKNSA